jgi:dipeptidyl aminopeptidase/acylaminoacyl peptidase
MFRNLACIFAFIIFSFSIVVAQQKKNLTPDDYGKWQSIGASEISPNGEWVAYQITVAEDNDTLFLTNRNTNKIYKLAFASSPEFSKDNKWIAFRIGMPFKDAEKLREDSKPIEYKMGLLNLETGRKETIQNINRFGFSRNGKFLAVYINAPKENKDKGSVLLLRNLGDSSTRTIGNVTEYAFNKKSDYISYVVESANAAGNSVELFNLNTYVLKVLASDTLKFSKINWQKEGEGLSFFKTFKDSLFEEENAIVYAYTNIYKVPSVKIFNPKNEANFPKGMRIYNGSDLKVSDDQSSIFFGLKNWTSKPANEEKKKAADSTKANADSTKLKTDSTKTKTDSTKTDVAKKDKKDEKLAAVDIWHWNDPEIQPRQKNTYTQDKEASYLSVWNIDNNRFYQLAKETTPDAQLSGNQKYAITSTNKKYKPAFKEDYADAYLINVKTGEAKLVFEKTLDNGFGFPQSSPDGKYLYYFKDKNWWSYNITTQQNSNLTENINTKFWNTRDDHPASRPPFGLGGWTKGDKEILLYDEYNIWAVKPDGKGSRKITDGEKEEIVFRINRVDYEEPYLDDSKPIYLSAYGDKTKKFGYYKYEKGKTEKLIYDDVLINRLTKAKDADAFTYVKQDYHVSPKLFATDNFVAEKNIVSTNPQQQNYYWGKSELMSFTNAKGQKLQGALFYPANYEAGKKYPMVVYIYELLSNTVHSYINPGNRSAYNTTNFTTGGYFIFRPDIVYDVNDPGLSAVNCVVPAVKEVLKTGMIDADKIGLMGHSWGAYQTSFIITQTNLFHAACAGAPLTDLISMSMSIYWNQGITDQKIFETSQGRFDGPWYDRMQEHMRNSPMFNADKIATPLLVAFGDKDGAVDWHQGIEMYGTMRRMMKPHVMLVYADENHGLAKKENQIDYQKRQRQWFDHYLLGKPAEKWITDGVSYLDKMKEREKQDEKK